MPMISLIWKEFPVKLDKIHAHLKAVLSANYDGLVADENALSIIFLEEPNEGDSDSVNAYWDGIISTTFNPTPTEIVNTILNNAIVFGNGIILEFATSNVLLGITQANKTKEVSDYCHKLSHYLGTGSLYAAIGEIDHLLSDIPSELAPFITETRLSTFKSKIMTYLGLS